MRSFGSSLFLGGIASVHALSVTKSTPASFKSQNQNAMQTVIDVFTNLKGKAEKDLKTALQDLASYKSNAVITQKNLKETLQDAKDHRSDTKDKLDLAQSNFEAYSADYESETKSLSAERQHRTKVDNQYKQQLGELRNESTHISTTKTGLEQIVTHTGGRDHLQTVKETVTQMIDNNDRKLTSITKQIESDDAAKKMAFNTSTKKINIDVTEQGAALNSKNQASNDVTRLTGELKTADDAVNTAAENLKKHNKDTKQSVEDQNTKIKDLKNLDKALVQLLSFFGAQKFDANFMQLGEVKHTAHDVELSLQSIASQYHNSQLMAISQMMQEPNDNNGNSQQLILNALDKALNSVNNEIEQFTTEANEIESKVKSFSTDAKDQCTKRGDAKTAKDTANSLSSSEKTNAATTATSLKTKTKTHDADQTRLLDLIHKLNDELVENKSSKAAVKDATQRVKTQKNLGAKSSKETRNTIFSTLETAASSLASTISAISNEIGDREEEKKNSRHTFEQEESTLKTKITNHKQAAERAAKEANAQTKAEQAARKGVTTAGAELHHLLQTKKCKNTSNTCTTTAPTCVANFAKDDSCDAGYTECTSAAGQIKNDKTQNVNNLKSEKTAIESARGVISKMFK